MLSGIVVSGKKLCPSGGRMGGRADGQAGGRPGVTFSFPDHYSKAIILTFMKFGIYLALML